MLVVTDDWGWPQWIVLTFWALSLIGHFAKSGDPQEGVYNGPVRLIMVLCSAVVLAKGGFF